VQKGDDNYVFEIIRRNILTDKKVNMGEAGKTFPIVSLKREIHSNICCHKYQVL
jgi:hypothetical protein